ncbi:sigma factor [Nocardiopsis sp. NPDC006832]|uniref:RNA polymerase sigma factor n=1 Tax=Nocardiopsis sp. NPDC006832 TaxID=3157188 RepID=UPI0033C88F02
MWPTDHHADETAPDTVPHSPPSADVPGLLVSQARSGHAEALESLFTLTRTDVTRFIAGRVTSEWVEDLTQETFSRALRGLPRFAGRSSVRSWLFSVARYTVADRYRLQARTPGRSPSLLWRTRAPSRRTAGSTSTWPCGPCWISSFPTGGVPSS